MIVPTDRLLIGSAMITVPLIALATAVPETMILSGLIIFLFFITVSVDAVRAPQKIRGLAIAFPEIVRLSKGRQGHITIDVLNEMQTQRYLRLGIRFPSAIEAEETEQFIAIAEGVLKSRFTWHCTGLRQGNYRLSECYLEVLSVMGFWAYRTSREVQTEFRIFPDLMGEKKGLAALFLNKRLGVHLQRRIGKGRDFEQLREYIPGDGYEDIHWKATAKRRFPITKVYQVERSQEIYVIIDASRLSAKPVDSHSTVLDRYITAALVMAMAAQKQADRIGILVFSDKIRRFIRAKSGKTHYSTCRDALYTLIAGDVSPDFSELFTFIGTRIRRRSLMLLLTNLEDPVLAENFMENVHILRRRHLLTVNMMKPAGADPLFYKSDVDSVEDIYDKLSGHLLWHRLRETGKVLHRNGVGFNLLENEKMCVQLVSSYLSIKQKQML